MLGRYPLQTARTPPLAASPCGHRRYTLRMPDAVNPDPIAAMAWVPGMEHPLAALRRITGHQIVTTLSQTAALAPDDAVHQMRRGLKQVRAVIALAQAADVNGADDSAARARTIHHSLSGARDLRVLSDLIAALRRCPDMRPWDAPLAQLAAASAATMATDNAPLTAARWALGRLPSSIGSWTGGQQPLRLTIALGQSVAAVVQAMTAASTQAWGSDFHRWRRRIKTLAGQLTLWAWMPIVTQTLPTLGTVGHDLGLEHDLDLLAQQATRLADTRDRHGLITALHRRQATLRRRALQAGPKLCRSLVDDLMPAVMQTSPDDLGRSFTSGLGM